MKKEDSRLLLGLAIGLAAGAAIAYLSQAENRAKVAKGFRSATDKLRGHLDSMLHRDESCCCSDDCGCESGEQYCGDQTCYHEHDHGHDHGHDHNQHQYHQQ